MRNMKLTEIQKTGFSPAQWEEKGYVLPQYEIAAMRKRTQASPTWVHFGAGNIFRAFPAAVLENLLNTGEYDRGVIVAEGFDYEIIDRAYRPYENLSLLVVLQADGTVEKRVVASVTESLKADAAFIHDWARLEEIFCNPSLQMVSFTITEKGYAAPEHDFENGLTPVTTVGKLTVLLHKRFLAGEFPLTLQSMDNCSHNGDILKKAVLAYAQAWEQAGLVSGAFCNYLRDENKLSYPWSMIDKITPRPDAQVQKMLEADGFADTAAIVTEKHSYTAAFVNAEETEYLVVEDCYPNGRPPLEKGGVLYTDRETVDKVERMKVCTCLNPLHTAMSIYGCMLGFSKISDEMRDGDIRSLITKLGYTEAMPVVTNPGVLDPAAFLDAVLTKRLPNPFMPDAPQRIATDTSQKLPIRFGETIRAYQEQKLNMEELVLVPLVLAGYARYLKGVDDAGNPFEISPDPLLSELQEMVSGLVFGAEKQDGMVMRKLFSRKDVFGVDLYEAGLGDRLETMTQQLYTGPGAVRKTLHAYVKTR